MRTRTLRVEAGTLARATLALPARRAPAREHATASASTPRPCRRGRSSPPCASSRAPRRRVLVSATRARPRAARARRGAGAGGVREMRLAWPLGAARAAARAARARSATSRSSGGARATRSTTRTSTCWRRSPRARRAGARSSRRCSAARAGVRRAPRSRARRLRMSVASEQASIALVVDMSGSMSAEDVKPTRLAAAQGAMRRFLDALPDQVPHRPRDVLVRAVRRRAADARPQARPAGARSSASRSASGTAIGDALARAVELLQPRRSTGGGAVTAAAGRSRVRPGGPLSAILLLSDGAQTRGMLAPLEGAAAREVVRHPRLHGGARHAGRRAQARRLRAAGAARPRDAAPDRPGDRRRVLRHAEPAR